MPETVEELGVDVLEVLTKLFMLDGEVIFDNYVIKCPHPDHEDNDPSCQVRLTPKTDSRGRLISAGTWHCFACNARGDLFRLGSYVLDMKRSEIRKLLSPNNPEANKASLERKLSSLVTAPQARVSREEYNRWWNERPWLEEDAREPDAYEDGPLTYLYERGFTPKIVHKWGVRYVPWAEINIKPKNGEARMATIKKSIAIPIRDEDGVVIAWCLAKGTLINTPTGERKIEDIQPGDVILAYTDNATPVRSPVVWSGYTGTKRTVTLHLSNGRSLRCTPEHKLLTRHGWRRADECYQEEIAEAMPYMPGPSLEGKQNGLLHQSCFSRGTQQAFSQTLSRMWKKNQSTINYVREVLLLDRTATQESSPGRKNGRTQSANQTNAKDLQGRTSSPRVVRCSEDQMGSASSLWSVHNRSDFARTQRGDRDLRTILARSRSRQGTTQKAEEGSKRSRIQIDRSSTGRSTPVVAQACSYARVERIEPSNATEVYDISLGGPHAFGAQGIIVHNCYRRTDASPDWQPRYLYTHGSPRSAVWINGDHCLDTGAGVVVAEGALDAMWIEQSTGGVQAVAVGGTGVDVYRARSLAQWKHVTLFMDRDRAGRLATWQIGAALANVTPTSVVRYNRQSHGKDPQDLDPRELRRALRRAIPWPAWAFRLRLQEMVS